MDSSFRTISETWMWWSVKTFNKATSFSSLEKAELELQELKQGIVYNTDKKWTLYEYADVIMCLLHSAAKEGFTFLDIEKAFTEKAEINYNRKWELDETGNTYSHKKPLATGSGK